jgi:ketosteroid isomerase-like protein
LATSEGGLWDIQTPKEVQSQTETNKNTLDARPHHIEVTLLGKNKDVAYTNHYAVGKITGPDGKVIVENYRTRVSETYVKENGQWKVIGNHYSPLYGGSGVIFDLD